MTDNDLISRADALEAIKTQGDSAATEALGQRLCCNGHMCGCRGATVEDWLLHCIAALPAVTPTPHDSFQSRVQPWMEECFGAEISGDKLERGDRLLEEVFELLQSGGYPRDRIAALEAYVWSRDLGEPDQEVGGVMVTLAAYCLAHGLNMHSAAEVELARVWTKVEKIRAKQATKPKGSALPQFWQRPAPTLADALAVPEIAAAIDEAREAADILDQLGYPRSSLRAALAVLKGGAA